MRRVIDDRHYAEVAEDIKSIVLNMPEEAVSKYSYGMYRASSEKIKEYILRKTHLPIKFGKSLNTTVIGNNEQYEIIYSSPDEEEICGAIHLTDNMYGSEIVFVTDYDGHNRWFGRTIRGKG